FAANVETLVIVPVVFRRVDAVTDKDDIAVDRDFGLLEIASADEIFAESEFGIAGPAFDHELRRRIGPRSDHLNLLEIASVSGRGFESERFKLRCDVFGRESSAARPGAASFEQVVGQVFDVRAQLALLDL